MRKQNNNDDGDKFSTYIDTANMVKQLLIFMKKFQKE